MKSKTRSKIHRNQKTMPNFGTPHAPKGLTEPRAKGQGQNGKKRKGLQVMSEEEFENLCRTPQRRKGEVISFDFMGYVKYDPSDRVEKPDYYDVFVTNGLRGGISVSVDGDAGILIRSPKDVEKYVVRIIIPSEIQISEEVVCTGHSCYSAAYYKMETKASDNQVRDLQDEDGVMMLTLAFDPKEDPEARDKVKKLALLINDYLITGKPLERLREFIRAIEEMLLDPTTAQAAWNARIKKLTAPAENAQ